MPLRGVKLDLINEDNVKAESTLPVLYQTMLAITNQMLGAAKKEQWEQIFILQETYEECEKRLMIRPDLAPQGTAKELEMTNPDLESINDMIRQLLAQQRRLQRAIAHRQDQLIQLMRSTGNGAKQIEKYRQIAFLDSTIS